MNIRNHSLDGIRAIAVMSVVALHAGVPGSAYGSLGVDVFFVLSGYLITGILIDKPIALTDFYSRRIRRLTPPLAILLIIAAAFGTPLVELFHAASYSNDYVMGWQDRNILLGHTWSLSVEEHFYLMWPLAILLLKRSPKNVWFPILVAVYLLSTIWRDASFDVFGYKLTYFRFDTRLSGLMLGGLLAVFVRSQINKAWLVAIFAVAIAINFSVELNHFTIGTTIAEVLTSIVILQTRNNGIVSKVLSASPLAWTGRMSYGIYLFHFPISIVMFVNGYGWAAILIATVVVSFALAALSFYTVERYVQTLGRN